MTGKYATNFTLALATAAELALASAGASAANLDKEVRTAAEHAGYAANSDTLKLVHTHLHHAVNCLVGPNGDGFDADFLDPCKGMGGGAIDAATDMKTKKALNSALDAATSGIAADSLSAAQKDAKQAASDLKAAMSSSS